MKKYWHTIDRHSLRTSLHAADALNNILSGKAGFVGEVAVLTAITIPLLCLAIGGMRWREV